MKTVYGWVVVWPNKRISIDLFFSSRGKFLELFVSDKAEKEQLVEVEVEDSFDDLDYIPDNY